MLLPDLYSVGHPTSRTTLMPNKHQPIEAIRKSIEEQTAEFLKAGGKIQEVPAGATGMPSIKDLKRSYQVGIKEGSSNLPNSHQ